MLRRILKGVYEKPTYSKLLDEYVAANPEAVDFSLIMALQFLFCSIPYSQPTVEALLENPMSWLTILSLFIAENISCLILIVKVQSLHLEQNTHTSHYAYSVWPRFWPQHLWEPKRIVLEGQWLLTTVLTTTTEKTCGISGEVSSEYHRVLWIKVLYGAKKVKKISH